MYPTSRGRRNRKGPHAAGYRSKGTEPAVRARVEVPTELLPFADMRVVDVVATVLKGTSLTQPELEDRNPVSSQESREHGAV